ncbi:MAG: hypothetical protein R8M45_04995 [Ghiorsea sp.]
MFEFWSKPRQVVVLDAQSSRPARTFYVRPLSILLLALSLMLVPFVMGSWYAPFHSLQEIIPQNLQLKRQNNELVRKLADANTLNDLKDDELDSLDNEINGQEDNIRDLSTQLLMFKSILDARKGTGVQLLQSQARWTSEHSQIDWQAVLVKGGSLPRFVTGHYKLFAVANNGQRLELKVKKNMKYRFETHAFLQHTFEWHEAWQPSTFEFIVYKGSRKVVLKENILISGE